MWPFKEVFTSGHRKPAMDLKDTCDVDVHTHVHMHTCIHFDNIISCEGNHRGKLEQMIDYKILRPKTAWSDHWGICLSRTRQGRPEG